MSDLNSAPSPAPVETVNTPSPDDSLKAIASEFPVEEQARNFTATPSYQPQPQPQQFYAPDPVTDAEGYKAFAQMQHQSQQQTLSQLREVSEKFNRFEQTLQQQRVNADVDRAVQTVNQKLKVDPDLAEALLNMEYSKNPNFKKIFDNREKNPMAYERALVVITDKLSAKVQVRQDPQLAENVRAARSSQQTMATTRQNQNDEWDNLSPAEFDKKWRAAIRG